MDKVLEAALRILQWLDSTYGPAGVVGVPVLAVALFAVVLWLRARQVSALEAEKERTIQRLAADNRELRIVIYRDVHKWSAEEIDRWVLRNEFPDGPSARKALEGGGAQPESAKPKSKPGRRRS